jgi:hypothetical protein
MRRHIAKLCAKKSVSDLSDDNSHYNVFDNLGLCSVIEHEADLQYVASAYEMVHSGAAPYP